MDSQPAGGACQHSSFGPVGGRQHSSFRPDSALASTAHFARTWLTGRRPFPTMSHIVTRMPPPMPPESLAEFEFLVMLAALRLGPEEAYTVSIAEDIARRTGRSVRRANVFTTLQRLEAKGLIRTGLSEPRPERGGRPRRLVSVEPEGLEALRSTNDAIRAMVGGLGDVLGEAG